MFILYKNIKERRLQLGMSQQELAEKAGYTDRSSIAKIEAGKVDLTQSKVKAFAKALNATPGELMGDVDSEEKAPISEDDIKVALFGGNDKNADKKFEDVKRYIEFLNSKED